MPRFGLDSTSMVPLSGHHAVGSTVALRYLSRFTPKVVTRGEHAAYKGAGIDLVTVFEDGAQNALGGFDQGRSDAQFASAQARALGMPRSRPIFFAVDFDESVAEAGAVAEYFKGAASVLGAHWTGCYGSYYVVKRLFDAKLIGYGWQTYAWSGGQFDERCRLYQYSNDHTVSGVGVDYNHVFGEDFGQWDFVPKAKEDPYKIYYPGPFLWQDHKLYEKHLIEEYDKYRAEWYKPSARKQLKSIRAELKLCADRLWYLAHTDPNRGHRPANWTPYHRGERFQGCWDRYKGKRVRG